MCQIRAEVDGQKAKLPTATVSDHFAGMAERWFVIATERVRARFGCATSTRLVGISEATERTTAVSEHAAGMTELGFIIATG